MTRLVRPTPGSGDIQYGEWIGRIAFFLFNGYSILAALLTPATLTAHDFWAYHGPVAFRSIPSLPGHIDEIHAPASR
jgi:hypothetical protein